MDIPSLQHAVQPSELPFERLAGNPAVSEPAKVHELSRQFEAVLLRKILQDAQKVHFQSRYNPDSAVGSIYQDMVTSQLADRISKAGTFGLGRSLERQLSREISPRSPAPSRPAAAEPSAPASHD